MFVNWKEIHSSFTGSGKVGPKHTNVKTDLYKLIHLTLEFNWQEGNVIILGQYTKAFSITCISKYALVIYQSVTLLIELHVGLDLRFFLLLIVK